MPYRIRFYPKGATKRRLLRNVGKISSTVETIYPSRARAKNSRSFKHLKDAGLSPKVERFKRKR